jgi:hypothetical protein
VETLTKIVTWVREHWGREQRSPDVTAVIEENDRVISQEDKVLDKEEHVVHIKILWP